MAKKSDTWMPFYVTDYLGDTMHLSTQQHGAYLLLLLACWKAGGELPDDDDQLVSITRLTAGEWRKSSAVLRRFFAAGDGVLSHGRVKFELEKAKELSEKRSAIGKTGGRPPKENQTETNRFPEAEAKPKQTETPSPSHSSSFQSEEGLAPTVLVGSADADTDAEAVGQVLRLPNRVPCPADRLVEIFHEACPSLPRVMVLNAARRKHLTARWREVDADAKLTSADDGVEIFRAVFAGVNKSDFLCGRTQQRGGRSWQASFDWLIQPTNFLKVCEGHYENERRRAG